MPRLILAIALGLVAVRAAAAGPFEDGLARFRAAAAAHEEGREAVARAGFREAAATWEAMVADGVVSTRLYANIGNARAFAGDLGEAVLAYRRALVVDPDNARAAESLLSVRRGLGLEPLDEEASAGLVRALFFWHDTLSFGARRVAFSALWIGGFALIVAARRRRRLRIPAGIALATALAVLVSLAITDADDSDVRAAVLLVRTEGRTGDGTFYSASHSTPLPAGAELTLLEERAGDGGWVRARLLDGTTTWLPAGAVERVVP